MSIRVLILAGAIILGHAVKADAQERWQGLYGGLSVSRDQADGWLKGTGAHDHDTRAARLGVYGGYNFTRSGSGFVWGPEVALSGLGTGKEVSSASLGDSEFRKGFMLDTRVRAGFATETFFVYGLAGLALTNAVIMPDGSDDKLLNLGTSYGLGAEMALSDNWSARIDATRSHLGGYSERFNGSKHQIEMKVDRISLGLTRRF